MAKRRWILLGAIILFSFLTQYGGLHENRLLTFLSFLMVIVAGLVLYQSADHLIPKTSLGIIGYFAGRLLFLGLIVYTHAVIFQFIVAQKIEKDSVPTYGIATGISSTYLKSKRTFYRHFVYVVNGKVLESKIHFSDDLKRGDTLYFRYSRTHPHIIQFDDNRQNQLHGIVK